MDIPGYDPRPSARADGLAKAKEKAPTQYEQILTVLGDNKMTVSEIAEGLWEKGIIPFPMRQLIHPRICEMLENGEITVATDDPEQGIKNGKRKDKNTNIKVTVYERRS